MADALKEMFNKHFYEALASEFKKADKGFESKKFVTDVTSNLNELSLNQRLRNTSIVLKKFLPDDYKKSIQLLHNVIPKLPKGYTSLVFPDFVGLYGHKDFKTSMEALKYFTQFGSSEFAIREFLKRDFNKTINEMMIWAEDKNHHVRRLASEGCRPRLPWSFKLDEVIKNPNLTLPILEKLKCDKELYVKKSVANHLNDFSKDSPDWLLNVLHSWNKTDSNTQWIVKHASRTLIKKGNQSTLSLFAFEKNPQIKISNFKINKSSLRIGEELLFQFELNSVKNKAQKLVIDYAIHYQKKAGKASPKVFKLKEVELPANGKMNISKKQSFQNFSTRQHYPGKHKIDILINGKNLLSKSFELVN